MGTESQLLEATLSWSHRTPGWEAGAARTCRRHMQGSLTEVGMDHLGQEGTAALGFDLIGCDVPKFSWRPCLY